MVYQVISQLHINQTMFTHCGLADRHEHGHHWFNNSILIDGTKPLAEQLLNFYQQGQLTFRTLHKVV